MPAPSPIRRGSAALIEQPDSPKWNFGEVITCTRVWLATDYAVALAAAPLKGAIGTGIVSGLRVRESLVNRLRGGMGSLSVTYESTPGVIPGQGAQLPDDEAEIVNEKLERALPKHPRYAALTEVLLNHINVLLETSDDTKRATALAAVTANALANNLYLKLKRRETHYLIYAPVYRLLIHSWAAPINLEVGGFRQAPPNDPIVAPVGYQWIREGDRMSFNGSTWIVEQKWLGAPEWDADIYP